MPKLNDTQLVILSAAVQRDDGTVLPLPKSLKIKGAALTKTLDGMRKKGLLEEKPAAKDAQAWREGDDGRRMMLVITDAGLKAIEGAPTDERSKKPASAKARPKRTQKTAASNPKGQTASPAVRQGTKQALLIDLLKGKNGATISEIAEAIGWQAHSVRGAISGAIKKKLGFTVTSDSVEGRGRVYRIVRRG